MAWVCGLIYEGWIQEPNPYGSPEIWNVYKNNKSEWRLKIKAESSFRHGYMVKSSPLSIISNKFHSTQNPVFPTLFLIKPPLEMIMENLKIYIDRLKGGQTLKIDETLSSNFLDIHEQDLLFEGPVRLKGEAYLANEHLIIHLNIETTATLPCSVCNDPVHIPIVIKNIYLTESLSKIKGATFDMTDEVRESILLQTPLFTECHQGKCPEREKLKKFLNAQQKQSNDDIAHFPFADLDKE